MNVFKSLFGSLIGAAIATTIFMFVKPENASSNYWFPVLAGLLVGMLASMLGGNKRNSMARLISGGLAAVVTAITLFGVELAPSLLIDNSKGALATASRDVSGRKPSDDNSNAAETEKAEDKKTDAEDKNSTDAGTVSEKQNKEPSSFDESKKTESDSSSANSAEQEPAPVDRNIAPPEAGVRGATRQADGASARPDNSVKMTLAKLERKRKMDFWMQIVMPGIGILLAFQLARGFGNSNTPAE